MAHTIEPAKSGRARCRKCKQSIAKGELRFGLEEANAFSDSGEMSYRWFHLACGAAAKPAQLAEALGAFGGEVPERAALEAAIAKGKAKQKPSSYPYAERAPSARAACVACGEKILKGALRVAVEREVDTGSFVTTSAGYLHPACAPEHVDAEHVGDEGLGAAIRANTVALSAEELDELVAELERA